MQQIPNDMRDTIIDYSVRTHCHQFYTDRVDCHQATTC